MSRMTVVRVDMPPSEGGPYDAIVHRGEGGMRALAGELARRFPGRKTIVVADRTLDVGDLAIPVIDVPGGEELKTLPAIEALAGRLIEAKVDRRTVLVAVGGGAVGDAAGFCAATILRGIDYVHVPTTLLSMVDSSIGGKTAVNLPVGKNLVGAFHQPRLVFADLAWLRTLPARDRAAGLGEVCKHALLRGEEVLRALEGSAETLRDGEPDALFDAVVSSVEYKARVVSADPRELVDAVDGSVSGRITLNLGHTIGHALERASHDGADPLRHGEAVALGLVAEAQLDGRWPGGAARIAALVSRLGLTRTLPDTLRAMSSVTLRTALLADKKQDRGALRLVLLDAPGRPVVVRLDGEDVVEMLLTGNGVIRSTGVEELDELS